MQSCCILSVACRRVALGTLHLLTTYGVVIISNVHVKLSTYNQTDIFRMRAYMCVHMWCVCARASERAWMFGGIVDKSNENPNVHFNSLSHNANKSMFNAI